MKLVRFALISVVFLFLLVTGIGLLFPSHVLVSRAITVQAPADSVRALVFSFERWETWINQIKPGYATVSKDSIFLGTTRVKKLTENDSVQTTRWTMMDGESMESTFRVLPVASDSSGLARTIVQWQFDQKIGWLPWERMASMMNDKMLGTLMEENLTRLQMRIEKK